MGLQIKIWKPTISHLSFFLPFISVTEKTVYFAVSINILFTERVNIQIFDILPGFQCLSMFSSCFNFCLLHLFTLVLYFEVVY